MENKGTHTAPEESPDLILEAGVNHEGSLAKALEMVEAAAECGVYAIKFQTYKASRLAAKDSPQYWDPSKEPTKSQFELFSKYDKFNLDDYQVIADHCQRNGVRFATTFFDENLLDEMDYLVAFHKIASADITNIPLIRAVASKGKPILLSTGASTISEVREAVELIRRENEKISITILHCVLNYPTQFNNAHLSRIKFLQREFPDQSVGYSDHTTPEFSDLAIQIAVLFGARSIETHFTLDKNLPGNDHYHSLNVFDVKNLQQRLIRIQALAHYEEDKFLASQSEARKYARRGLYARVDIVAGTKLSEQNMICLRPIPDHGLPASSIDTVIGKKTNKSVQKGYPINMDIIS